MNPVEELGQWVVVTASGQRHSFPTNAAAWRWIDRHEGEAISRWAPVGPQGWENYPNLLLRPHAPNAGRGRLQRQIRRAFLAGGAELTSSQVYDWCALWPVDKRASPAQRWSVRRILDVIAERAGRATTIGRPWIWRLKQPGADGPSASQD
jgi:hypothetical protein